MIKFKWCGVPVSLARNSAAEKIGNGKRGRAKIPSPKTPSFLPARASGFVPAALRAAMGQFLSKKVRAKCIITAMQLALSRLLLANS